MYGRWAAPRKSLSCSYDACDHRRKSPSNQPGHLPRRLRFSVARAPGGEHGYEVEEPDRSVEIEVSRARSTARPPHAQDRHQVIVINNAVDDDVGIAIAITANLATIRNAIDVSIHKIACENLSVVDYTVVVTVC